MKNILKTAILLSLIFVIIPLSAQTEVGKLFYERDAIQLFGSVTKERSVPVSELKSYLDQTNYYLYVNLDVWNFNLAGDELKAIYPVQQNAKEIYYKFSKTKVIDLLNSHPDAKEVKIQWRTDVLSLQVEDTVLELSLPCPPYCE